MFRYKNKNIRNSADFGMFKIYKKENARRFDLEKGCQEYFNKFKSGDLIEIYKNNISERFAVIKDINDGSVSLDVI